MSLFLLRISILIAVLLALPIFFIRAQPYDDSELRTLLNCPTPCFIGIRPGVTTVQAAVQILEAQPSFADTVGLNPPYGVRFRANHPHGLIDDSVYSYLERRDGIIQWFRVHTNMTLGDVWAAYGQPDWGARTYTMGSSFIYYAIGYNHISFEFAVNIEQGQIDFADIFRKKVTLRIGSSMKDYANMNPRLWQYTSPDLSWWHSS
jgi:hypothetical protein